MSRIQILLSCVGNIVQRVEFINNEFIFYLDPKHLLSFTRFLKFNSLVKYEQLMDITGVDYPSRKQRFEVVYQFLTIRPDVQYRRLRVKTLVDALTPIESITSVYPTAG
jgi:NADH dehydrogenase (ubiquinone) Fe-S protein 3